MLVEWEFKHVSVNFIYKYTDRLINLNDIVHEPSELLFGQLSLLNRPNFCWSLVCCNW